LYSIVTFWTKENDRVRQVTVYLRSIDEDCQFRFVMICISLLF